MKFHFESDLDYQRDAIEAVCDLFCGQEICRSEFSVSHAAPAGQHLLGIVQSDLGVGNQLSLADDALLSNLRSIQIRNGIVPSTTLASGDFTIEMETGTGKTYVYLRTVFELNKRYGFTKFVIVVPSIAIKRGVYKTLEMTAEHFKSLYAGTPCEPFLYDSAKLGEVRNFATSPNVQIMVVTVGAINKKDVNNLYKESEKTGDERPVDLIRATHPIIIVDEPQSVDGGLKGAGKTALESMNPLCTLRYSATHVDQHHMVYRLDAVDAYERKLVKQIEVASATVEGAYNKPFVQFVSASSRRNAISARVTVDIQRRDGVQRTDVTVHDGDDLEQITGRALYTNCRIGEIRVARGAESLELRVPGGDHYLTPGQAWGTVDSLALQRELIRRTIREHLDKEMRLRPKGIKVLTLFFIDAVHNYRQYDADRNAVKGPYALIFEEEYRRLAAHPDYQSLGHATQPVGDVHNGYFSIDKKGGWTDTDESTQADRDNAERAYNLIMTEKEKLLGFETPLAFIFSHSALKEGWDNPNVFQICTLREIQSERERRQTIGRGLRLCVDQNGDRVRGFDTNRLTVIATESYEQFAAGLQHEIEIATGVRFGVVDTRQFVGLVIAAVDGVATSIDAEQSRTIWQHLHDKRFIDAEGQVQSTLRTALRDGTFSVPEQFFAAAAQIEAVLRKLVGRVEIVNADDRRSIKPRHAVLLSDEFKALWDRIKHKTTYRVQFDNARLIEDCIQSLRDAPPASKPRLQWRKADIAIGRGGIAATERAGAATVVLPESDVELPDILTELQDRTQLTRRTIHRVLVTSGRLDDFKHNPQSFIDLAASTINACKRRAIVAGISYQRIGNEHYYAQELFDQELVGHLQSMIADTQSKSAYEYVLHDSENEAKFATALELNSDVKLFAKLPGWFMIPTPLGTYNPDWAVLVEDAGRQRLYLVVETKGSLLAEDLREAESGKIACGRAHFRALRVMERPAEYIVATTLDDALARTARTDGYV